MRKNPQDPIPQHSPEPQVPGRRTGEGSASILPLLVRSLATKPQVPVQSQDAAPGVDFVDSKPPTE